MLRPLEMAHQFLAEVITKEDVVVDADCRGRKYGKLMIEKAIDFVRQTGNTTLMLTSRPSRVAANALYQSAGFERKETNVYKMKV